jgi:hypothetical protein
MNDLNTNLQLKTYGAAAGTPFSNLQGTLQVLQVQQRWTPADRRLKQRQGSAELPDGLLQLGGFLSSSKATPLDLSLQSTGVPAPADSDGAGAGPQPWQLSSFPGMRHRSCSWSSVPLEPADATRCASCFQPETGLNTASGRDLKPKAQRQPLACIKAIASRLRAPSWAIGTPSPRSWPKRATTGSVELPRRGYSWLALA